jgi:3-deoxy-D-manno-octulosonic-acid transferase
VRVLYIALAYLLTPAVFLHWAWRARREPEYLRHWSERLGYGARPAPGALWVHAVSAGEVQAAAPVIAALRTERPGLPLLITTTTPAGRRRAQALFGTETPVRYLPLDLPGAVHRFLIAARPALGLIIETELWPNLYRAAARRGLPIVIASARVSARSARRYARFSGLMAGSLAAVRALGAQTADDARRFVDLGAQANRVSVTGNVKFDFAVPASVTSGAAPLRARLGSARAIWVAGSTHAGEESVVLDAHEVVRARHPSALLVLAPRHPPRFAEVAELIERRAVAFQRWSQMSESSVVEPTCAVLLLDTLGDLLGFYAAGDVAFVGGSLVPIGGHNLLEPAALGRPVLTGPHCESAAQAAQSLAEVGAAHAVRDAATLAAALARYFADPDLRNRDGAAGRAVVESNRGASARVAALAAPWMPGRASEPSRTD